MLCHWHTEKVSCILEKGFGILTILDKGSGILGMFVVTNNNLPAKVLKPMVHIRRLEDVIIIIKLMSYVMQ